MRDTAELRAMGFPVWTAHVSAQGTVKATARLGQRARSSSAGSWSQPGDVVVADDDGVTIVPRERAAEALEAARRARREGGGRPAALPAPARSRMDLNDLRPVLADLGVTYVTQAEYDDGGR